MSYSISKNELIQYQANEISDFHVYGFEWIDNLMFLREPSEYLDNPEEYVNEAKKLFLEAGWLGDGDIKLLWLPPFVFPLDLEIPATGLIMWHVKQDSDGVSFLVSPLELPFEEFSS